MTKRVNVAGASYKKLELIRVAGTEPLQIQDVLCVRSYVISTDLSLSDVMSVLRG